MTDREAMLAALEASPEDDTARLAFADFLDERGESDRAAFVRDRQPAAGGGRAFAAWRRRAASLCWPFLDPVKVVPLPPSAGASVRAAVCLAATWCGSRGRVYADVRGGCVVGLACHWSHFRRHAAAWFAANPIGWVYLHDCSWPDEAVHVVRPAGPSYYRSWSRSGCRAGHGRVPAAVYDRLGGWAEERFWGGHLHRCYPDAPSAHVALSRACVGHGRELAGLNASGGTEAA